MHGIYVMSLFRSQCKVMLFMLIPLAKATVKTHLKNSDMELISI